MRTARPESLRIGPLTYEVRWEDDLWRAKARLIGQHNPKDQCIRLVASMRPDQAACILVHEAVHALASLRGNDNPEETMCDVAGYDLAHLWQDNPAAFAWYCEALGLDLVIWRLQSADAGATRI